MSRLVGSGIECEKLRVKVRVRPWASVGLRVRLLQRVASAASIQSGQRVGTPCSAWLVARSARRGTRVESVVRMTKAPFR
jgi:hypothetical protein